MLVCCQELGLVEFDAGQRKVNAIVRVTRVVKFENFAGVPVLPTVT